MSIPFSAVIRVMRPLQWLKNAFVVAGPLFANRLTAPDDIAATAATVVVFCLVSSAVYVFNDISDAEADRAHPEKRDRPIASGALSPGAASGLIVLLLAAAGAVYLAAGLPYAVGGLVLLYVALNVLYSTGLKSVPVVEMFFVASGFVIRLLAGGVALGIELSLWIIAATGLLALLIAAGKRRAEIAELPDANANRDVLRAYNTHFLDLTVGTLGAVTIVTYMMFVISDYATHRYDPALLMLSAVFVVYGVLRYMQMVMVMRGADSPTVLVVRDPGIRTCVILWAILMVVAVATRS